MLKSEFMKQFEYLPNVPIKFVEFEMEHGNIIREYEPQTVDKQCVFAQRNKEKETSHILIAVQPSK